MPVRQSVMFDQLEVTWDALLYAAMSPSHWVHSLSRCA